MSDASVMQLNLANVTAETAPESDSARKATASETLDANVKTGDSVSVKYRGKEWRKATVVDVRPEGSYDVAYGNDEQENGVPPSMVKLRDSPRSIKESSPAFDLTIGLEAAMTPRGSGQKLQSRQELIAYIYRLQATIEEQAETIRLQEISIAALKRQTETITKQAPTQSLSDVKVGTVLFYRRVVGAEVERVEVIELFPPPPQELAFFMVRVVASDRKGRIGVETQVTINSQQASYRIEDFEEGRR